MAPFRGRGEGGGPDDPTLEQRVAALERSMDRVLIKVERIDEALRRIEDALKSLAIDNSEIRKQLADVNISILRLEGRISAVEGRMTGIEGRFAYIPTTWQMIGLIGTLLIGLSGLIFTASRFLHP